MVFARKNSSAPNISEDFRIRRNHCVETSYETAHNKLAVSTDRTTLRFTGNAVLMLKLCKKSSCTDASFHTALGMYFVANYVMFLASKGYVQLQVRLNEEVKIIPLVSEVELKYSAKAIARSVASILNYQLKGVAQADKESAVKEYLKRKGWKVQN